MMEPDFQQPDPALQKEFQNDKTKVDYMYASAETLEGVAETGKDFEVTMEELDKEIARYDHTLIACAEPLSPMGPIISDPTNPPLHPNPTSPLANITNLSPSQTKMKPNTPPKWTRIERQGGSNEDSVDLDAALGKRSAHLPHCESKPPKRRNTYTLDQKENIILAVEAGSQPC